MSEETKVNPQQYAVFSEPLQIAEDVSCCLKVNAVIAKEGVYIFPAGLKGENINCLWSRQELLKATPTARAAKIAINGHPQGKVVTKQNEMYGVVEKPFFDRDRIRAVLSYDKAITPLDIQEKIRLAAASKERKDATEVSIGFYYASDFTPGDWHGQHYDMIMRDMVIDHVATALMPYERGRCQYPNCGIGVSSEEVKLFMAASLKKSIEATSVEVPAAAVEAPKIDVPPVSKVEAPKVEPPKTPTPKQYRSVDTNVKTEDLLTRSASLLKMFNESHVERLKNERRQPA